MICIDCKSKPSAKGRKICLNCKNIRYRNKYPIKAAYYSLKGHAKSRGKVFELTYEQFKHFCVETDYINKKGRTKNGYHVDRIDESKGYTIDNMQLLTNSENIRKYIEYVHTDEDRKKIFKTRTVKNKPYEQDDCPF